MVTRIFLEPAVTDLSYHTEIRILKINWWGFEP